MGFGATKDSAQDALHHSRFLHYPVIDSLPDDANFRPDED